MDARRLHTGVSRAYTRARIQCALTLQLELGLFVRIRAYSGNLLSYEYGSNLRLALKKVTWDWRLKSQAWLGTFNPGSPPFSPVADNTATPGSMNKRDVVMNTDFPALCSQILETTVYRLVNI
jgi:hypothetical protein